MDLVFDDRLLRNTIIQNNNLTNVHLIIRNVES